MLSSVQPALTLVATYLMVGKKLPRHYGKFLCHALSPFLCLRKSFCRWIYCLILTIDAKFRLKLKEKGIKDDPALGDGWGHWVQSAPYQAYYKKYSHQTEVCSILVTYKLSAHSFYSQTIVTPTCALSITWGPNTLTVGKPLGSLVRYVVDIRL